MKFRNLPLGRMKVCHGSFKHGEIVYIIKYSALGGQASDYVVQWWVPVRSLDKSRSGVVPMNRITLQDSWV